MRIRQTADGDGAAMWQLVRDGDVLELNSAYCYLLMTKHFDDTCFVAEDDGKIVGFLMAYRPPARPDTVFVWQVGVAAAARGQGLAGRLLEAATTTPGTRYLEASVAVDNAPSRALFRGFARRHGAAVDEAADFVRAAEFPGAHETEKLFRIGPLHAARKTA